MSHQNIVKEENNVLRVLALVEQIYSFLHGSRFINLVNKEMASLYNVFQVNYLQLSVKSLNKSHPVNDCFV